MATVRIYRVAELLNTTSQEVMALLKRDHGIEVKSASSTIEEVVGRQFVERLARQRDITLPGGDLFADGASAKAGKKSGTTKKGAAEPAKPAAPSLGPPRLVKSAKAVHQAERAAAAAAHDAELAVEPADETLFETRADQPEVEADVPAEAAAEPITETPAEPAAEPEPAVAQPAAAAESEGPAEETPEAHPAAASAPPAPTGRVVPPTIRLRVEEAGAPRPAPAPRPSAQPRSPVAARSGAPGAPVIKGPASRTGTPTVAPPRPGPPPPPRPSYPSAQLGGPRPLPSQPVRPQTPGYPPRPGMPARPGMPSRPGGGTARPTGRPASVGPAGRASGPRQPRSPWRCLRSPGPSRSPKA